MPSDGGIELLASVRPAAALELVSQLAARRPGDPVWLARKGDLLLASGRHGEAFEMYRQYLPEHPGDRKRLRAVVACGVQGGLEAQVRELLETVAQQHPDRPDARNYLGVLHLVKGELDQAEAVWQELLAEDPRYGPARANMGIIYHFRGRFAQAILEFKLAMELDAEFGHISRGNLGNAYYLLGRYEEAREVLEGLVRQHPDYAEARLILARALAAVGAVEEAIALLETVRRRMRPEYALAVDTSLAEDLALLARLYLQRGDLEDAETACRQSLAEGPDTLEALTLLGQICLARGKPQEAVDPLEKAASLSSGEPRGDLIHRQLALAYYHVGRVAEATEAFRKAGSSPMESLGEDDPDPARVAARLEELYRRLDAEGESTQTLLEVGRLLTAQGRVREAVASLSRAVALAPEWAEAHYELGKAYYLNLENDRAVVEFNRALEKDPALARAHTGLGLVAMVRGRPAEAAAQLRIAQAMDPDDPVHRVNLATLARWTGQYDEAAGILDEVLRENPSCRPALLERQRLHEAREKSGVGVRP
ncbi:tetratricopeptide repeat protein [Limnochorda pilosa]|uniref:tetratricopeptide repeat protein n=1 Tax=Limnochorda pilosa TaxID=1555112 RepID=UPI000831578B|nr:tetratricopeptide repeat protein [Limnochorda pilosa]